ncbi:MAG: DUF6531 domain-containing protein, partial [Gammaproteobacteria bacterium]
MNQKNSLVLALFLIVISTSVTHAAGPLCAACFDGSYDSREEALAVCLDRSAKMRATGTTIITKDCHISDNNPVIYEFNYKGINSSTIWTWTSTAFGSDCAMEGQNWDDSLHGCVDPPEIAKSYGGCCTKESAGDPINFAIGNNYQKETDFVDPFDDGLKIERYYNSRNRVQSVFGYNWTGHFERRLVLSGGTILASRGDGKRIEFNQVSGVYTPDADIKSTLSSSGSGWQYTTFNGDIETFDSNGILTSIKKQDGREYTLAYDADQRLISVTGPLNRTLTYSYNSNGLVSDPNTQWYGVSVLLRFLSRSSR